ncbi:MAG: type I phosphomannose isomerase catalytic subunit [Planctomycetota bacterium]
MEPLLFEPIFIEKIWGAANLARVLGKSLPPGKRIGESFEVSRRPGEESVVARGPEKGRTLREIIERDPVALLGREVQDRHALRFPLLLKFIDANDTLSVQVHPSDRDVRRFGETDTGKDESWYVVEARPGTRIVKGLRPGTTSADFRVLLAEGRLQDCLRSVDVHAGEVIHLPAGTVHAIGAGLVLVELQRNSNVTYRVFDWNRTGPDGRRRPLHVERAIEVIDWEQQHLPDKVASVVLEEAPVLHRRLVETPYYSLESYSAAVPFVVPRTRDSFRILIMISGCASLRGDSMEVPCSVGDSWLLPGALDALSVIPAQATTVLLAAPR